MPEAASSADLTPDLSAMSDEEANLEGLDSESCEGEMKSKVESLHVVVRLEGDSGIKIMELLNFTHKKKNQSQSWWGYVSLDVGGWPDDKTASNWSQWNYELPKCKNNSD